MLDKILSVFKKREVSVPAEKRPFLITRRKGFINDYHPDPAELCFCGSEKYFKNCCGSMEEKRQPPYGVLVVPNYLSEAKLAEIRAYVDQQAGEPLKVIDEEKSTPGNIVQTLDERRISEFVPLHNHFEFVRDSVQEAFARFVPAYFKTQIEWFERPHLMRYRTGGHYMGHADSENINVELNAWEKVIDRDVSLLLYLNNDFEGGELFFNKFNYRLRPEAGMLVMFPSDHRYMHTAETVYEGVRYAIVSWASAKGMEKVASAAPENIFRMGNVP